ncbi:MAG: GNAT family N-acetyltransferase [Methanobrevibacter sp.]|uniref:GNAT family N-acetyltransferase n=1 Tax=Methanobrevibacter sp. TaxID=66852 RepID=UPI0026E00317|nr:GNAT family N-acetyltransferase [Methanobrevibacter sp.]MDO5848028.1 GNAT family N-acetyltransferase [Methanobrevibacter sp.]
MNIDIKPLSLSNIKIKDIQKFLFNHIKEEFGYGYVPSFHNDIVNLKDTYLTDDRNNFYVATNDNGKIIGCIGVRGYDKHFEEFEGVYFKDTTASIWRLMIDSKYRRKGIGSRLVKYVEKFSESKNYQNIYLHTQRNLPGALQFWQAQNYSIIYDSNNEYTTVHMIKNII